jgi:TRAP-type uncharacterized transport system substrate-binding protein
LAAIFLAAAVLVVATLPPRTVVMATGAEGGANHALGLRYREILAKSGVRLRLLPTAGGLENLARLRDPASGVSAAFVQGGTTTKVQSPDLESLGTLFYEPLWLFRRSEIDPNIQALRGKKVSIGPEGSAGRALALEVLKRIKADSIELFDFTPQVAAEKLVAGEIDAAFMVTGWESPVVQRLITSPGVEIASVPRADAYVALYPFLSKLLLPAGVANLSENRPPADVVLLAPKASLAVRDDVHPAIQHLLLEAAMQIHSQPGIFQKAGQLPAAESMDLPLSSEAQRFYKNGRPYLQEYLPFWIATLLEKIIVVFLPLIAVVYPIFKLLPQLYDWRLYDEMKSIESEIESGSGGIGRDAINAKLDQLGLRANQLRLPTTYASALYTLRSHMNLVRARLADRTPR